MTKDCLIIGAGISGLLTAWYLHKAGLSVTVVDQGEIGRESSWAGGGIISPLYPWRAPESVTQLAQWSQTHYKECCDEWAQLSGVDSEYTQSGLLILESEEVELAQSWAKKYGQCLEWLSGKDLSLCEPELKGYDQGLWLPEVAQIRNPRLLKSLKGALTNLGVQLFEQITVQNIQFTEPKSGHLLQITGARFDNGDSIPVKSIVITAGAWSSLLLGSLQPILPIKPIKGQMILYKTQPGFISRIVLSNDRYVIPRRDGHLLVGSTLENSGFDKSKTPEALEDLKYAALNLFPTLSEYSVVSHWAGLRPSSPDGIPFIGEHPAISGLYLNAGHFRNGIALGLASAQLLTNLITKTPPILDFSPYKLPASPNEYPFTSPFERGNQRKRRKKRVASHKGKRV